MAESENTRWKDTRKEEPVIVSIRDWDLRITENSVLVLKKFKTRAKVLLAVSDKDLESSFEILQNDTVDLRGCDGYARIK